MADGLLEFERISDVVVHEWGLPSKLLQLLSLADDDQSITPIDVDGNHNPSGPYWIIKSSLWAHETSDDLENLNLQAEGSTHHRRAEEGLSWLARKSQSTPSESQLDFVELFSPPRVLPYAEKLGLRVDRGQCFDLTAGWDVRIKSHRMKFRKHQRSMKPQMLMESPECRAFTQWRHSEA